jgi:hypothetical protein
MLVLVLESVLVCSVLLVLVSVLVIVLLVLTALGADGVGLRWVQTGSVR